MKKLLRKAYSLIRYSRSLNYNKITPVFFKEKIEKTFIELEGYTKVVQFFKLKADEANWINTNCKRFFCYNNKIVTLSSSLNLKTNRLVWFLGLPTKKTILEFGIKI